MPALGRGSRNHMSLISFVKASARSMRHRAVLTAGGPRPVKLRLAVTNRCNARCVMCNVWKADVRDAKRNELTLDEYRRMLTASRRFLSHLKHVSLTGGETTLRTDLAEIVNAIAEHYPTVSINVNTNAFDTDRLMTFVEKAAARTSRLTVMVSLDGMGETHDRMRGVLGAFEKAFGSIRSLIAFRDRTRRIKVGINTTLSELNGGTHLGEIHEFCVRNGVKFTPIVPQSGEFFNNEEAHVVLGSGVAASHAEQLENACRRNGGINLAAIEVLEQLRGLPRDYRCWAGSVMMLVEEQGQVFPNGGCPSSWSLGNVREHNYDLGLVARSAGALRVLKKVQTCRRCRLACETLTTLRGPEALAAHRKLIKYSAGDDASDL